MCLLRVAADRFAFGVSVLVCGWRFLTRKRVGQWGANVRQKRWCCWCCCSSKNADGGLGAPPADGTGVTCQQQHEITAPHCANTYEKAMPRGFDAGLEGPNTASIADLSAFESVRLQAARTKPKANSKGSHDNAFAPEAMMPVRNVPYNAAQQTSTIASAKTVLCMLPDPGVGSSRIREERMTVSYEQQHVCCCAAVLRTHVERPGTACTNRWHTPSRTQLGPRCPGASAVREASRVEA